MFDFAQKLQIALKDRARGVGLKVAGGVAGIVAAGFLLAALWSFLAHQLDLGSTLASLGVAVILLAIAAILFVVSKPKQQMPTTDELKREVEARVSLAADIAADRARAEATRVVDIAGNKAHQLMDEASYRALKLANDAERKVFGTVRNTAQSLGLTPDRTASVKRKVRGAKAEVRRAANTNEGSMAKLVGAFAVGATIAAALAPKDRVDDDDDHYY